ncbi:MAG: anaerobic carbon-monoxide dehydrogenase catalytic subunit [Anaerostipes sp.]|nr:anaerobic carbon-monoxide dehydrogenase catalytic subunit [Anaerostipes sp.]
MSHLGEKPHQHRALIGFDEHGVPTVIVPADKESHTHTDENGNIYEHFHEAEFTADYMNAVSQYRKTFPSKQEVLEKTPDPAVRELMLHMEQLGVDTAFDRFDQQQPQCSFGLGGICCKICNMGPCRITPKSPRGVCGADADLIVARNLLRSAAAGVAQHGMHAREVILSLKWAAQGKLDLPIIGEYKVKAMAEAFGIPVKHRTIRRITIDLADALLEDLSRTEPEQYKTIQACATKERQETWKKLDILPISAYHEVFEAYHKTGCGTDGDWKSIMQQFLRCGLTFTFTGVVAANIATDCLFGVGDRVTSKVNVGALEKGYVNIAVHGHLPTLVSEIVKTGLSKKYQDLAKEKGAKGIKFYGICCSGLSAMYRYAGVIPLSNAVTAELVMGTGALDLWVADVQDVFPSIMNVANCFKTAVVTTSDSARLPGAEHIAYDHHHSNIGETKQIAQRIVERAIENHEKRKGTPVYIPPYEVEAEVGFSVEYVHKRFGSMKPMADALKSGKILGIVNLVGCNNPKVVYERTIVEVADVLLKNNILILTNGCAAFPLMKLGYCTVQAQEKAGDGLREFLESDLPPVWHVGECIDNTRSSGIFAGIAGELNQDLKDLPYGLSSPEWGNEKGIDAALGFRLLGINSYHCVEAQIHGSANVIHFLKEGTRNALGSVMHVDTNPTALGEKIVADFKEKRKALGWD